MDRGWTRRRLAGIAARGAGALAAGTAWGAFGAGARAAAPTRGSGVISLTLMPWYVAFDSTGTALMKEATAHFEAEHPGLRLTGMPGPDTNNSPVGTAGAIMGMLGGQGPDVVADCCNAFPQYLAAGVAARLDGYLSRDGISTSIWSKGHVAALTTPDGLFGLPAYDGPEVLAYRQDFLDEAGLAYPSPDWTHAEAEALWRRVAGQFHGSHRYGAVLEWFSTWFQEPVYLLKGFGGAEMDPTGTRCLFDSPGSIQAGEWIYPLLWDRVVAPRDLSSEWGGNIGLPNGSAVFEIAGGWDILPFTLAFGGSFKWDFHPVPVWPKGRATFVNNDFYVMNAHSPHPEAAWEVMKWVAAEKYYQRFIMMKVQLAPPSLNALWDEFEAILTSTAPVLRTKSLHYFRDAATGGYTYPEEFFRYAPSEADSLIDAQIARLWGRKTDVASAFAEAARQVNALEAQGGAFAASAARRASADAAAFARAQAAHGTVTYAAPPRTSFGLPPLSAAGQVAARAGAYTVTGAGAGGLSPTSDNGTFAASVSTASRGTFSCRLVSISVLHGAALPSGASVGLMARGSLSDGAAAVGVYAVGGSGINFDTRVSDGGVLAQNTPSVNGAGAVFVPGVAHPQAPGLIDPGTLFRGANALSRPVWLRLSLDIDAWTPWVSWDGRTWLSANPPANPPAAVQFAGAWVGLFVSSAASGVQVRAVFDHVTGFLPSTFVMVGRP